MFDRLLNRDTNTPVPAPMHPQPQPATVSLTISDEVIPYKNNESLPAELQQLILDAGWVIAGRTQKPKVPPKPSIVIPRLSIIDAYNGKTTMGFLRLPHTITQELGWKTGDKIISIQHPSNPVHKNKILLVKSGNNQGYALSFNKNYPTSAASMKFQWMQSNAVLTPTGSFMECTWEVKENNILVIQYDDTDIKTEAEVNKGVWQTRGRSANAAGD